MSYVDKTLMPDEKIVYRAVLHWIVFLPGFCFAVIGGLVGHYSYSILNIIGPTFSAFIGKPLAGAGLLVAIIGFIMLVSAYMRQATTELVITNRRIIAKYGLISRTTFEIMINRITGSNFDQTIWGRILGFGTVLVHGAGGDVSPIDRISDPQQFYQALMRVLEQNR